MRDSISFLLTEVRQLKEAVDSLEQRIAIASAEWLRTSDAADALGLSIYALRNMVKNNLPTRYWRERGKGYQFHIPTLKKYLEAPPKN